MSNKHLLTQEQFDELKRRHDYLDNEALPNNSNDIAAAVAQGDLSENAEYDNAKEEQAKLQQELAKIKHLLANARIIEKSNQNDAVEVGHVVTIKSLDTKKTETITLMGYGNGKTEISINSPLGSALLGKEKGMEVLVDAPIGELRYMILDIQ